MTIIFVPFFIAALAYMLGASLSWVAFIALGGFFLICCLAADH